VTKEVRLPESLCSSDDSHPLTFSPCGTGIEVVRQRIKGFAQKKVTLPPGRHKIVILDEADSMTSGAQQALRRTMEIYSNTTRFAFACNQSNKIIEPLQSRCAILRFAKLTDAQVVKRLLQIIEAEGVEYTDDGLAALVFSAEGDMRQDCHWGQCIQGCRLAASDQGAGDAQGVL
jgi:DNA polymerase III delta prime subunit